MMGRRPLMVKFVKSAEEYEPFYRRLAELVRHEFGCVKQVPSVIEWNERAHPSSVSTMIGYSLLLSERRGAEDLSKEYWTVQMHVTKLPSLYFYLEESVPHRRVELPSTQSFVTRVLEAGLADFALVDRRKSFLGHIWSIYLSTKIGAQKSLLSQSMDIPAKDWEARSVAAELIEKLEDGLDERSDELQVVGNDRRAKRGLLSACDTRLLVKWGETRFANYVSAMGISLKDWLSIA